MKVVLVLPKSRELVVEGHPVQNPMVWPADRPVPADYEVLDVQAGVAAIPRRKKKHGSL